MCALGPICYGPPCNVGVHSNDNGLKYNPFYPFWGLNHSKAIEILFRVSMRSLARAHKQQHLSGAGDAFYDRCGMFPARTKKI